MSRTDARAPIFRLADDAPLLARRLVEHNQACCDAILAAGEHVPVRSLGIVGAGLMGTAIAAASLAAGLDVVIHDADSSALDNAAKSTLAELIALNHSSEPQADRLIDERLSVTSRLDEVAQCDLVLESITEKIDAKRGLYAEIEPALADDAILATNTSTIPVERLAVDLRRPERFCAAHFFHPVGHRPLVEVVRGPRTNDKTVARAVGYARAIGKMALVVDDGPGFVVNRLLMPYLTEAAELLLDGVAIERVESVATEFGMAKGPLALLDEIGLDTAIAGGRVLWEAFPSRVVISPLMIAMYKTKRFGVKSSAGFFNYAANDKSVDRVALEKIAQWKRTPRSLDGEQIRDRLLLPMVVEAAWLLEEKKVAGPSDVDLGTVFGLGFPAARGGLLRWADTLGPAEIVSRLEALDRAVVVAPLLHRMAGSGHTFHDLTAS